MSILSCLASIFASLHGPLLYLYTFVLSKPAELSAKVWLANALLPLGVFFSTFPFLLLPIEQKVFVFQNDGLGYEDYMLIVNILMSVSGIAYIYLTNRLLLKHRARIQEGFSNQEKIDLDWLRFLFYGMGLIWVFIFIDLGHWWTFNLATLFVVIIGYFGIRQVEFSPIRTRRLCVRKPPEKIHFSWRLTGMKPMAKENTPSPYCQANPPTTCTRGWNPDAFGKTPPGTRTDLGSTSRVP